MARRVLVLAMSSVVAGVVATGANADGLPVLGVDVGPTGVTVPSAAVRYVTLPGGRNTLVARVERQGGRIVRWRALPGAFTVPAVAYDGSASGLSADGRVLVLIQPRLTFPRARTTFAILDARTLRSRSLLRLQGDFSFDAISPRGNRLYLIQYLSPQDATRYAVRAYDLRAGRLLRAPVVDPHEAGEQMRGQPLSRAMSPDGRWAYTLYDGAGKEPFVHALDTSRSTARCIDLDELKGSQYLWRLRLDVRGGGRRLAVLDGRETELVVNTTTFEVGKPQEPTPEASRAAPSEGSTLTWPWAVGASALALAVAVGALLLVYRRQRRPALS
jgi:hypothetical protein